MIGIISTTFVFFVGGVVVHCNRYVSLYETRECSGYYPLAYVNLDFWHSFLLFQWVSAL